MSRSTQAREQLPSGSIPRTASLRSAPTIASELNNSYQARRGRAEDVSQVAVHDSFNNNNWEGGPSTKRARPSPEGPRARPQKENKVPSSGRTPGIYGAFCRSQFLYQFPVTID